MTITCSGCQSSRETTGRRLPRGWKRWEGDTIVCGACAKAQRRQISIVVPIASPVGSTWDAFGAALRESWAETTRCANWLATELYARDARRETGDTKLQKMPRIYLYPEARSAFPTLPAITIPTLIQQVEQTYRRQRYELLWKRERSLATYRYPVPLPLHKTQWSLTQTDGGAIVARVRILDQWWDLRLAGGAPFARQRQHLESLLAGSSIGATGAIYRTVSHTGDHRGGVSGDGDKVRVMLKLVVWVPRVEPRSGATHTLHLVTEGSSLLVGRIDGDEVVRIHADHVRRGIAGYETRRRRLADDLALSRRWSASERAGILARLERIGHSHRRAMRTWMQMMAAKVAQQARARRCAVVHYNDSAKGFVSPFPWTDLRLHLQHAIEGEGIVWQYASGEAPEASADPLASS